LEDEQSSVIVIIFMGRKGDVSLERDSRYEWDMRKERSTKRCAME
jgi:hypothetical protein